MAKSTSLPLRKELSRNKVLYLLILIPLAVLIIFKYIPMYGVQIAFKNFTIGKGILGSPWVGLKNFISFFNTYYCWQIIRNTLLLNLYMLATFPLPLILALLINYMPSMKFKKTVQMVSYAPHFISVVVMCGMVMQFLSPQGGMINLLLQVIGIPPTDYMGEAGAWRSIYVWSDVWQHIGYNSIIYIATLAGVSPELYEAAIMDGATIVKRIWHVDIPHVLPTFSILLILNCGQIFTLGYEKVLLLQNNMNINVSEVLSTYVYSVSLASTMPRYSYATAVDLLTSVVNMSFLFVVNRVVRSMTGSSLW